MKTRSLNEFFTCDHSLSWNAQNHKDYSETLIQRMIEEYNLFQLGHLRILSVDIDFNEKEIIVIFNKPN